MASIVEGSTLNGRVILSVPITKPLELRMMAPIPILILHESMVASQLILKQPTRGRYHLIEYGVL